ncbi:TPA: outer membrane beta-barrel protein [Klebsiella oxytoca]|nr:outer membrane beta-barrel protein [Klebsiella oxytoca]
MNTYVTATYASKSGPYIGVETGANWISPQNLSQSELDFVQMHFKSPMESGYIYGIKTGWRFPSGVRTELEHSYRKNTLGNFSNRYYEGNTSTRGHGSEAFSSVFINLWYDVPLSFKLTKQTVLKPYFGTGIGYGVLAIDGLKANGVHFGKKHTDDVGAWQVGGGFFTDINEDFSLSLDYRYMRTSKASYGLIEGLPPQNVTTHYSSQSVMLGIHYNY